MSANGPASGDDTNETAAHVNGAWTLVSSSEAEDLKRFDRIDDAVPRNLLGLPRADFAQANAAVKTDASDIVKANFHYACQDQSSGDTALSAAVRRHSDVQQLGLTHLGQTTAFQSIHPIG